MFFGVQEKKKLKLRGSWDFEGSDDVSSIGGDEDLDEIPELVDVDISNCDLVSGASLAHVHLVLRLLQESDIRIEERQVIDLEPPSKIRFGFRSSNHLYMNDWEADGIRSLISWLDESSRDDFLVLYSHYLKQKVFFPFSFSIVSSLNGCNGEWTNSDDRPNGGTPVVNLTEPIRDGAFYAAVATLDEISRMDTQLCLIQLEISHDACSRDHSEIEEYSFRISNISDCIKSYYLLMCVPAHADIRVQFDILYFTYVKSRDFYPHSFYLISQLNGNNGEWTNSDDVESKGSSQGTRARNHKESITQTFYRKDDSGKKKVKPGFIKPDVMVDPLGSDTSSVTSGTLEPLVSRVMLSGVYEGQTFVHDKDTLCTWSDVYFNVPVSEIVSGWHDKEFTYHPYTDGDIALRAVTMFDKIFLPTFKSLGGSFKINRLVVYSPILVALVKSAVKIPTGAFKNFTALYSYFYTKHPQLDAKLVENSIYVYLYDIRSFSGTDTTYEMAANFAQISNSSVSFKEKTTIYPVNCDLVNDWDFNGRWKLISKKGFKFRYSDKDNSKITKYPTFDTLENPQAKYINDCFCRFVGKTESQYYEINGFNYTSASSRLLKARKDEGLLYSNQLSFLSSCHHYDDALKLCGAHVDVSDSEPKLVTKFGKEYPIGKADSRVVGIIKDFTKSYDWSIWYYAAMAVFKVGLALWDYIHRVNKYIYVNTTDFTADMVDWIFSHFREFLDHFELVRAMSYLPSAKRPMYITWGETRIATIFDKDFIWESKLKKEPGKAGKAARLYTSGEEHSMVDRLIPELMKKVPKKSKIIKLNSDWSAVIVFADAQDKANSDYLYKWCKVFPPGFIIFVYYSDDGFICVCDLDGRHHFIETDISSCDTSNGPVIHCILYDRLIGLVGKFYADVIIAQCANPTKFYNPSNRSEYCLWSPETWFEYSGAIITTLLNNIASELISISIAYYFCDHCNDDGFDYLKCVQEGAKNAGYIVTAAYFESSNQVTFLKRAFNGTHSWLATGVFLRSFGIIEDGLSAEKFGLTQAQFRAKTHSELFEIHIMMRVLGVSNEVGNPILNAFRVRAGLSELPCLVTSNDLYERYGIECYELQILLDLIIDLKLGDIIKCSAVDKILSKDYGL